MLILMSKSKGDYRKIYLICDKGPIKCLKSEADRLQKQL